MSTPDTPRPAAQPSPVGALSCSPDVAVVGPGDDERYVVVDLAVPATPPRVLAGPAAVVWAAVDGLRDAEAVVAEVATTVGLAPDEVRDDVTSFLTALLADRLLHAAAS